jgi:hypothetical protein
MHPRGDAGERDRLARWRVRSAAFFAAAAGPDAPEGGTQDWAPDSAGWVALLRLVSALPGLVADGDPDQFDPGQLDPGYLDPSSRT